MNQDRAPVLEPLADYHRLDRYGFTAEELPGELRVWMQERTRRAGL